jgi:hypothetical protein
LIEYQKRTKIDKSGNISTAEDDCGPKNEEATGFDSQEIEKTLMDDLGSDPSKTISQTWSRVGF